MDEAPPNDRAYIVELSWGEIESMAARATATEALAVITTAERVGWKARRILREYAVISEAVLRFDAEKEQLSR